MLPEDELKGLQSDHDSIFKGVLRRMACPFDVFIVLDVANIRSGFVRLNEKKEVSVTLSCNDVCG